MKWLFIEEWNYGEIKNVYAYGKLPEDQYNKVVFMYEKRSEADHLEVYGFDTKAEYEIQLAYRKKNPECEIINKKR